MGPVEKVRQRRSRTVVVLTYSRTLHAATVLRPCWTGLFEQSLLELV